MSDLTDTTCEHGRPDHQVLIRQLAEALGLDLPALPDTPASVWHRLLADVAALRKRHTTALAKINQVQSIIEGLLTNHYIPTDAWQDIVHDIRAVLDEAPRETT